MALTQPKPLPPPQHVPIAGDGAMPVAWQQWVASVDALLRLLALPNVGTLVNAANDAAAAAAGVAIGGLYRNGSAVQIRVT